MLATARWRPEKTTRRSFAAIHKNKYLIRNCSRFLYVKKFRLNLWIHILEALSISSTYLSNLAWLYTIAFPAPILPCREYWKTQPERKFITTRKENIRSQKLQRFDKSHLQHDSKDAEDDGRQARVVRREVIRVDDRRHIVTNSTRQARIRFVRHRHTKNDATELATLNHETKSNKEQHGDDYRRHIGRELHFRSPRRREIRKTTHKNCDQCSVRLCFWFFYFYYYYC